MVAKNGDTCFLFDRLHGPVEETATRVRIPFLMEAFHRTIFIRVARRIRIIEDNAAEVSLSRTCGAGKVS